MTALLLSILLISQAAASTPVIDVVYPRVAENDTIPRLDRVDMNFIFGSVNPPEAVFYINDAPVSLESNGAFIAFLPVDWNSQSYRLIATHEGDTTTTQLAFSTRPSAPESDREEAKLPKMLELTGGVARTDPDGAYYLYPEPGTHILADGYENGYYRLPIGADRGVWIEECFTRDAGSPRELKPPVVRKVLLKPSDKWIELRFPLSHRVLYRTWDETNPDRIYVDLFNVISHIDQINYPPGTGEISEVIWDQPASGVLRLEISLSSASWGYNAGWEEEVFVLKIKRPPVRRRGIKGLRIAVDAGHGGDNNGAIGPTRLTEKEINLKVAIALQRLLEKKGAEVIMTRTDDSSISLTRRIEVAEENGADLLISLHHNALPDGTNPFGFFGSSARYYRPHSRDLALAIQKEVVRRLKLPDEGVYYHNLALVRPTAMPAALLETAYIILPEQEMLMMDQDYQTRLSIAVYKGIKKFARKRRVG